MILMFYFILHSFACIIIYIAQIHPIHMFEKHEYDMYYGDYKGWVINIPYEVDTMSYF